MDDSLPVWLATLKSADPTLFSQVTNLQDTVNRDGAIPLKTKTLMMMLADSFLARPHGVRILADRARSQGATEEEIVETMQVGYYMGGLSVLFPALNAFGEVPL